MKNLLESFDMYLSTLSVTNQIATCFFVTLLIAVLVILGIDYIVKGVMHLISDVRLQAHDELEFSYDAYASSAKKPDFSYLDKGFGNDGIRMFPLREYTCHYCDQSTKCQWSFDDYNTDGDCLASK